MFGVDLSWEFTEYFLWKNHNWLDIVWNTIGILIGIYLRYLYELKKVSIKNNTEFILKKSDQKLDELSDQLSSKVSRVSRESSQPTNRSFSFKSNPSTPDI